MTESAPVAKATPRRSRRVLMWLVGSLALLLAAFLLLRWALQPERLGALLLQRAASATGLELNVSRPATLGIWPSLQLELIDLSARMPGDASDLLRAERVAVGLPLAVLWSDTDVEFGELRLLRPIVDIGAVQRWLSRDADTEAASPPRLPPYAVSIDASDGRLNGNGWSIAVDSLEATPLRSEQNFELTAAIGLLREGSDPIPLHLQLRMRPSHTPAGITLDDMHAALGAEAEPSALQLSGMLGIEPPALRADIVLQLGDTWPERWPSLPAELASRLPGRSFEVDYSGTSDLGSQMQIAGPADAAEQLRIGLVPSQMIAWLQQPEPKSPLPPAEVEFSTDRVEIDGVLIEGLRIELRVEPDAVDD